MEHLYRAEHVRRALATDPRVGLGNWDVQFTPSGRGVVCGVVETRGQRAAIDAVLASLPEATGFLNRTRLRVLRDPAPAEAIAPRPGGS